MTRGEIINEEKEYIERIKIAMNKSVKDIKPVNTTAVILKNAPPTKSSKDKSIQK